MDIVDEIQWAELCVSLNKQYAQAVAEFLIEEGSSNGIVEEKSPADKDIAILKAYIKNDGGRDGYVHRVAEYMTGLFTAARDYESRPAISVNLIADEDWNKKWKSFFQPLKITGRPVARLLPIVEDELADVPIFGSMAGTVTFLEDDITAPIGEMWDADRDD